MDDEHQTNFVLQGAPSGGWHWSALVRTRRWGSRGRGVTGGDQGRLGAQHYQHFC